MNDTSPARGSAPDCENPVTADALRSLLSHPQARVCCHPGGVYIQAPGAPMDEWIDGLDENAEYIPALAALFEEDMLEIVERGPQHEVYRLVAARGEVPA